MCGFYLGRGLDKALIEQARHCGIVGAHLA